MGTGKTGKSDGTGNRRKSWNPPKPENGWRHLKKCWQAYRNGMKIPNGRRGNGGVK